MSRSCGRRGGVRDVRLTGPAMLALAAAVLATTVGCATGPREKTSPPAPSGSSTQSLEAALEAQLATRASVAAEVDALSSALEEEVGHYNTLATRQDRDKAKAEIEATQARLEAAQTRLDELDAAIEADAERYDAAAALEKGRF